MKNKGLNQYRFKENPLEKAFAKQWEKENVEGRILDYLLAKDLNYPKGKGRILDYLLAKDLNYPKGKVTDRDREVAATVIQWLGSPCGQSFVEDVIMLL